MLFPLGDPDAILGTTRVHTPNGISIGSFVFAQRKHGCDQQTERHAHRLHHKAATLHSEHVTPPKMSFSGHMGR